MASIQALLTDIDLRYRNTFTTAQKLVWMTEEQLSLFEILEIDSAPYSFPLQTNVQFYPIPASVDVDRIKTMTIQVNDSTTNPVFSELTFRENDDGQPIGYGALYYSIVGGSFFIPNGTKDDRQVYVYMDAKPIDLTTIDVTSEPSVPVRFQELLKLGTLKCIAAARKDVAMYNNYDAEYQTKIMDLQEKMQLQQPEFHSPIDTLPRRSRSRSGKQVQFVTINTSNNNHTWEDVAHNPWSTL